MKPFSAKELLARVGTHLDMVGVRRESEQRISRILESITDAFQAIAPTDESRRTIRFHRPDRAICRDSQR